jgi:hypothetical protein
VRAYLKAGFQPSSLSAQEQARFYGPGEFADTVTLEYRIEDRKPNSAPQVDRQSIGE